MSVALETIGLKKRFGGLTATSDLSFRLEKGARQALIGPNGAGKTTLINLLTGVIAPSAGRILLGGAEVTSLAPHKRVRRGLARTFQITQLFPAMTPLEALCLTVGERKHAGRRWFGRVGDDAVMVGEASELLDRFGLADVMTEPIGILPYGRQRVLEIAVALASKPSVLLLDEPAAGVPEEDRHGILAIVAALPREVTVLLIEHDMDLVFSFAERISVLVDGALLTEGRPEEVARDARVREAYLGEAGHG